MHKFQLVLHIMFSGPPGDIECSIVRPFNTVIGDFLANAEALHAACIGRVSLDDIAHMAQLHPLSTALSSSS